MTNYEDIWYQSQDELTLYARLYGSPQAPLTLFCMHGLTRNSADFEALCRYFSPRYRVVAVDQRGRGRSAYDTDAGNYHPGTYVQDMFTLIDRLKLERPVLVGTSLGGLVAMLMASLRPGAFAGLVLNDVGPVLERQGLQRIRGYVGQNAPVTNWGQAIALARSINQTALPDYSDADWESFAHKLFREDEDGRPVLNYDPAIAELFNQGAVAGPFPDLWETFEALVEVPCMVLRGETSDILSRACVAEMQRRKPDLQAVEVSNRGHAPMLDEPQAIAALERFITALVKG